VGRLVGSLLVVGLGVGFRVGLRVGFGVGLRRGFGVGLGVGFGGVGLRVGLGKPSEVQAQEGSTKLGMSAQPATIC
jgi:hypothetical protein